MKTIIKSAAVLVATMTIIDAFAQDTKKPASPPTATGKKLKMPPHYNKL
jgi:hypothetical protein